MMSKRPKPSPDLGKRIGKRRPFAVREEEVFLNLARAYLDLAAPVHKLLRANKLSDSTFNALNIVVGHGDAGVDVSTLTQQLIFPAPDTTRLVMKLESLGLAHRQRDEHDRRVVHVIATPKGRDLAKRLRPMVQHLHRDNLSCMTQKQAAELIALLETIRNAHEQPDHRSDDLATP